MVNIWVFICFIGVSRDARGGTRQNALRYTRSPFNVATALYDSVWYLHEIPRPVWHPTIDEKYLRSNIQGCVPACKTFTHILCLWPPQKSGFACFRATRYRFRTLFAGYRRAQKPCHPDIWLSIYHMCIVLKRAVCLMILEVQHSETRKYVCRRFCGNYHERQESANISILGKRQAGACTLLINNIWYRRLARWNTEDNWVCTQYIGAWCQLQSRKTALSRVPLNYRELDSNPRDRLHPTITNSWRLGAKTTT